MEVSTDKDYQIVARKLMHIMLYDNGAVNRFEPDGLHKYPKVIFDKITNACKVFFEQNPEILTDEDLDNIAAGMWDENQEKYGKLAGYLELTDLLNEYFDLM